MPGYVKYCYKDGVLPTHIKSALKNYCISILTVQIIVAKNALIFMSKILRFTSDMPKSIRNLIPSTSSSQDACHEATPEWIDEYGTAKYRNSVFFKGPPLHNNFVNANPTIYAACHNVTSYKNRTKEILLDQQTAGSTIEWEAINNILTNIGGPRKLTRARA